MSGCPSLPLKRSKNSSTNLILESYNSAFKSLVITFWALATKNKETNAKHKKYRFIVHSIYLVSTAYKSPNNTLYSNPSSVSCLST